MPGKRHKWVKLREHTYICRVCGCGRVNAMKSGGWETTFHLPDGTSKVLRYRPECEGGAKTDQYLGRYADAIELLAGHQDAVVEALSADDPNPDAIPTMTCPKCGDERHDFDGFGFLSCAKCGHCTHPSKTDGICGLCGRNVALSDAVDVFINKALDLAGGDDDPGA